MTRLPRMLLSTSTFPLESGGSVPQFVYDLAESLAEHSAAVHVLAPGERGAAAEEVMGRVQVHRFTYALPRSWQVLCYRSGIISNIRRNRAAALLVPQFIGLQASAAARLCRRHDIRIVNSHWLITQGLTAAVARSITPFRHVAQAHAADVYTLRRLPLGLGRRIARFVVSRSDLVICASSYVRRELNELIGYDCAAAVCSMGVDYARFAKDSRRGEAGQILFFGRLVEKKGVQHLIAAMKLVKSEEPSAELTVVGGGALGESLHRQAAEAGLESCIRFAGPRNHAEIIEHLGRARVVAVPSIIDARGETEGMPTVVLEAMAAGKRIVASSVDGIPDVLRDGVNGWLCIPGDAADLSAKLLAALRYDGDAIPAAAQETARAYDWRSLSRRYSALLAG